jgi:RNA polymerase sigma-70 factor (ECF subfamily)
MKYMSRNDTDKEQLFLALLRQYDALVRKVCFMYSNRENPFEDLYQETMANLWRGYDSFRGEANISTWIYRTTVNTCITWMRRTSRYAANTTLNEAAAVVAGDDTEKQANLREMYQIISCLDKLEKAIVMMWLDEKSYDEIAEVTGLSRANVATRLHRIKQKIKNQSSANE